MSSLKLAVIPVLIGTPVLAGAGTVSTTVGRVVSASAAVMKLQTKALSRAMPVLSCAALLTVATHRLLLGITVVGVNVAMRVASA